MKTLTLELGKGSAVFYARAEVLPLTPAPHLFTLTHKYYFYIHIHTHTHSMFEFFFFFYKIH